MHVPFRDAQAALHPDREQLIRCLTESIDRPSPLDPSAVPAFEAEFSRAIDSPHGIAVSSGSDALYLSLLAVGVVPGDEVICPAHVPFASVAAIARARGVPVLVDVDPETLTLDPARAAEALTSRTRAILAVHLNGCPADMSRLIELAGQSGLRIVEDACQAAGAKWKGKPCGSLGDTGCFSFAPGASLAATGEAGFVSTRDADIAQRLLQIRDQGCGDRLKHIEIGGNFRMDEIHAAVLRLRLRSISADNQRRRNIARRYDQHFQHRPIGSIRPHATSDPVYSSYPVRVDRTDEFRKFLLEQGIETRPHMVIPANRQPALRSIPHRLLPLTVNDHLAGRLVALPIHPGLTDEQVDHVARYVVRFVMGHQRDPFRARPAAPSADKPNPNAQAQRRTSRAVASPAQAAGVLTIMSGTD